MTFFSLKPETDYTIRLYTSTGGVEYALHLENDATTTANSTANYDVADFSRGGGGGEFDLSDLNEDSAKSVYVMNELFATGEEVVVTLPGVSKKTKFVNRGRSASIVDAEALLLTFEEGAGASQSASLTL